MNGNALGDEVRRVHLALRRRSRLARALAWRAYPGLDIARGVELGSRLRLHVEPGGSIVFGEGCVVDDGVTLSVSRGASIVLGAGSFLGHHTTLAARHHVSIGDGTFLAELVSVRDHDHDPARPPSEGSNVVGQVQVGADCWLAAKVTVVRDVTIGDGVVVGANAVVTRDLPGRSIAVGVPARVIRSLAPDGPSA